VEIPDYLEKWRRRAIATRLDPSGARQLEQERSDDVRDDEDSVTLDRAFAAEFVVEEAGLRRPRRSVSGDRHLESVRKRNVAMREQE
jgi:hypothetical protein